MQAHSRWLHAIRKRVITEKKRTWRKKKLKIHNCFCKYAIEDNQVAQIPNLPKSLSRALNL